MLLPKSEAAGRFPESLAPQSSTNRIPPAAISSISIYITEIAKADLRRDRCVVIYSRRRNPLLCDSHRRIPARAVRRSTILYIV